MGMGPQQLAAEFCRGQRRTLASKRQVILRRFEQSSATGKIDGGNSSCEDSSARKTSPHHQMLEEQILSHCNCNMKATQTRKMRVLIPRDLLLQMVFHHCS